MTGAEIVRLGLEKPGAFLCYPFGPDVAVIKARSGGRSRIFIQVFMLHGALHVTFSCDAAHGLYYRSQYPDVSRGWHCPPVQQPYFITLPTDCSVPDEPMRRMLDESYCCVCRKLQRG